MAPGRTPEDNAGDVFETMVCLNHEAGSIREREELVLGQRDVDSSWVGNKCAMENAAFSPSGRADVEMTCKALAANQTSV